MRKLRSTGVLIAREIARGITNPAMTIAPLAVLAIIGLLIYASVTQGAERDPYEHVAPQNAAPATNMHADALARSALAVADQANTARGYRALCPPVLFVYDAPDHKGARADTPGCRVFIDRAYRNHIWRLTHDRYTSRKDRVSALSSLCELLAHERLHNLGLGHVVGDPRHMLAGDSAERARPAACRSWARGVVRKGGSTLTARSERRWARTATVPDKTGL